MEHLDTGAAESWYANRAMPAPTLLQRLAVIAPDDAPGLSALRRQLAQRGPKPLTCDHFAAGFDGAASASLASAFEQIRGRHAAEPYDVVLLLDGRPEALGIAESNGLIPEQVSRMPAPVWTAIGEDDANTELGDVANRVFPRPAALIDALPLQAAQPQASAAGPVSRQVRPPVAAPAFTLVSAANDAVPAHLPTLPSWHATAAAGRASPHPLVLCAAGAVIVASLTAVAAMLGWLPSRVQLNAAVPDRAVTTMSTLSPATAPGANVTGAPAASIPAARGSSAAESGPSALPATSLPEPVSEPLPSAPQSSGMVDDGALAAAGAAAGAAGLIAAAPRARAVRPPAKTARRSPRRQAETPDRQAQAPRQVGSTEVPVIEFVGTKSRQQVIAELVEARRLANRQAANNHYFPGLGGPGARR
jgi:hypothetical protein